MNPDNSNPPAGGSSQQPGVVATKPRTRSVQDQGVTNAITAAAQLINKALANPDIVALLAPRGYDAAELRAGLALQAKAQSAFNARQTSLGKSTDTKQARDDAWTAAKDEYADFRQTAQAKYSEAHTRDALGVSGTMPGDLQKFVTQATASYQTARQPAYVDFFAKRSFTAARLTAGLTALQMLLVLDNEFKAAGGDAASGTGDRDTAVANLNAWLAEFRTNAQLALRKSPAHLTTLGL